MEEQEILKYVQLYMQSLPAFETPTPKPKTKKQSKKDLLLLEQHRQIKELQSKCEFLESRLLKKSQQVAKLKKPI